MSNVNGKSDVTPTESETTSTAGNFPHGSRETPVTSAAPMAADRSEKARRHRLEKVSGTVFELVPDTLSTSDRCTIAVAGSVFEAEFKKAAASLGALVAVAAVQAIDRRQAGECEFKRQVPPKFENTALRKMLKWAQNLNAIAKRCVKHRFELGEEIRRRIAERI